MLENIFAAAFTALTLAAACPSASAADAAEAAKTAVVYFSWFDQTGSVRATPAEIDAVTGASLVEPGLVTLAARAVGGVAGETALPIVSRDPYPIDYDACLDQAVDEKNRAFRPALGPASEAARNAVREARVVFLGYPNWSYTLPAPVLAFIESLSWEGKTVVPFCVHGTGGLARTTSALRAAAKGAEIRRPLSLEREEVRGSLDEIADWARGEMAALR